MTKRRYGLKDGSGRGQGRAGGARRNKTTKCRHPLIKKRRKK